MADARVTGQNQRSRVAAPRFLAPGLARVKTAGARGPFSCGFSPAEFSLCLELGARPVAQVMGACASVIGASGAPVLGDPGYKEYFGRRSRPGAVMFEMQRISSVYDSTRDTALARMREQAKQCGSHAVIAVDVALREGEVEEVRTVEYVATGTAIRLDGLPPTDEPCLAAVSAADYWSLRHAGYTAVAIAAATSVYYVRPSPTTVEARMKRGRSAPPNQELPEFSSAVSNAREVCDRRIRAQAQRAGGAGIIGVTLQINHSITVGLTSHGEAPRNRRYGNLHLTLHTQGTVIKPLKGGHSDRNVLDPLTLLQLGNHGP